MKSYYRIMLGQRSVHAAECSAGGFIGVDWDIPEDLTGRLPDDWRAFNREFVPIYLTKHPGKSRVAAGLACGCLWTVARGIAKGDVVLCPDGAGMYHVGEVTGDYRYQPGSVLPHRRPVAWFPAGIDRAAMSEALQRSTGSLGTISNVSGHREEIERLLSGVRPPVVIVNDDTVEDPIAFALEVHLEEFLVANWKHTEFGKEYDIYEEDGVRIGQQYMTDTGRIDILAISKDRRRLLVVELKKGRASDVVVGQVLRYMGFVQEELLDDGQTVAGAIVALEDDQRIRRALRMAPNVAFYRYRVRFELLKS